MEQSTVLNVDLWSGREKKKREIGMARKRAENRERSLGFPGSREGRHVIRVALTDRAVMSRPLSQELRSQDNSPTTFSAAWTLSSETMPAATLDAASDRSVFNGRINGEPGRTNRKTSFFSDESRFCLQHQDGRICRLARHHTPVTTVDELWHRVEAAWTSVSIHAIQSLFGSIPRRISAAITARGGCSGY
ncbi:hypothetical protein TNCV_2090081 [Trichonephila clavipes]|nr:hypothetical protein TNCV_2090081 [Trichonephila clavipes]